ncbi:MAG: MFS transporter [Candidatus Rokuibacteriota bacterium]|nr:MAG: MFS transporter [Candidatus Rokubacteria bacterium]
MTRIVAYRPRLCHPAGVPSSPSRTIVAWTLYDFANSAFAAVVLATIYPAYYANAVVGNATGHGDFLWGTAISTAMVIGALTSPLLGGVADHAGARKSFLIGFTAVCVAATALMATVSAGMVLWGWVLAVVGVVTYEAAIVYYNSYLPRIAPREQLGRVSAAGFAVGYAGSVVAFLAAYPFAAAHAYWGCFLAAAVLFALTSLPAFVVLPGDTRQPVPLSVAATQGARATLATLREILTAPDRVQMRRFLMSYLIYEDGVNTVVTFAGIFAAKTLGFSFTEIIVLFMLVQITALLGSAMWARPTDTRGPKFVVRLTLVQWTAVTVLAFLVQDKWHFWVVAIVAGTGLGAVQAASRTFMATLVPPEREAQFFGFYSLVGKTGAVLGPVVFGAVSWLLSGNQRAAIVAVGLFFIVGLLLLGRVSAGGPTVLDRGERAPLPPMPPTGHPSRPAR